jgi:hypothetical protein
MLRIFVPLAKNCCLVVIPSVRYSINVIVIASEAKQSSSSHGAGLLRRRRSSQ